MKKNSYQVWSPDETDQPGTPLLASSAAEAATTAAQLRQMWDDCWDGQPVVHEVLVQGPDGEQTTWAVELRITATLTKL